MWYPLYVESKKAKLIETGSRMVVSRGCESGKWGHVCKGYRLPVMGWVSSGDGMYSRVTLVNNTILYTWKLLRE